MSTENIRINTLLDKMDTKKNVILNLIQSLPYEIYHRKPTPTSWSVAETTNHLYLSEKFSLAYLRKKLSYPDTVPNYHPKSWLGFFKVRFVLMTAIKVKAPRTIDMWSQQEVLSPSELKENWTLLRKEMKQFIAEIYPQFHNHLVYKHPFGGRMTIRQMLMFINDHIAHHTHQINRILKQVKQ